MEPIEHFSMWYPNYKVSTYYQGKAATVLTQKERTELYLKLSNDQKKLFDNHRKYRIRSFLLKTEYLSSINWVFSDLRVNPYFPNGLSTGEKLVCECGRPLKYQFILKTIDGKREIKLGINHFADHLNLSLEVAREIQKGINDVDIALDQLLILKKQGQTFPESQWQRYLFSLFQNIQLKNPLAMNQKLLRRIFDFRQVSMPIYPADFQLISDEVKKINLLVQEDSQTRFIIDREIFEKFCTDVEEDLKTNSYFTQVGFFGKQIAPFLAKKIHTTNEKRVFFQALLDELRGISRETAQSPFLKKDILLWVKEKYKQHQWSPNFFMVIPRSIKNGLLKARKYEVSNREQNLSTLFKTIPEGYISYWVSLAKDATIRENPVLFQSITEVIFPYERTGIDSNHLLLAISSMEAGKSFEESFSSFSSIFKNEVKKFVLREG